MRADPPYELVVFFIVAAIGIAGHAWWCLSRGVYHARRLRVVRAESPIEFWFWLGFQLLFAASMLGCGIALLFAPDLR